MRFIQNLPGVRGGCEDDFEEPPQPGFPWGPEVSVIGAQLFPLQSLPVPSHKLNTSSILQLINLQHANLPCRSVLQKPQIDVFYLQYWKDSQESLGQQCGSDVAQRLRKGIGTPARKLKAGEK